MKPIEEQTIDSYSLLWDRENRRKIIQGKTHFEELQNSMDVPIVKNGIGLEVGCGMGHDIEYMADKYPEIRFVAVDFSHYIFEVAKRLKKFYNIQFVRASAMDLPFKDGKFDFVYSFGVLHHTIDPDRGMGEINRILKDRSQATFYLYESHEDHIIRFYMLKGIALIREITVEMPAGLLYSICVIVSPVIYILFSMPSKLLSVFEKTRFIADKIPFNFGRHPFHLAGDLFDRFGTPVEVRYSRNELTEALSNAKFKKFRLNKMPDTAGWVVWSVK